MVCVHTLCRWLCNQPSYPAHYPSLCGVGVNNIRIKPFDLLDQSGKSKKILYD